MTRSGNDKCRMNGAVAVEVRIQEHLPGTLDLVQKHPLFAETLFAQGNARLTALKATSLTVIVSPHRYGLF